MKTLTMQRTGWVAAAAGLAAVGACTAAAGRTRAAQRRREMSAALASFLQLVALYRSAGVDLQESLTKSATVGRSWAAQLIGERVARTIDSGTTWAGLADLAAEYDLGYAALDLDRVQLQGQMVARSQASGAESSSS